MGMADRSWTWNMGRLELLSGPKWTMKTEVGNMSASCEDGFVDKEYGMVGAAFRTEVDRLAQ